MSAHRATPPPDPYAVLGLTPDAGQAEITAAYRRAVRACHPDTQRPDPGRLATVIAAYQALRDRDDPAPDPSAGTASAATAVPIPVRVHRTGRSRAPDLRAGPVTWSPSRDTRD